MLNINVIELEHITPSFSSIDEDRMLICYSNDGYSVTVSVIKREELALKLGTPLVVETCDSEIINMSISRIHGDRFILVYTTIHRTMSAILNIVDQDITIDSIDRVI